jgi:O-succinylhomoserine sulfhydrylase
MKDDDPGDKRPEKNWRPRTQSVRAGRHPTNEKEHSLPIFATSSFTYDSAEEAAARFAGEAPGNIYSRFTNPTVQAFCDRLATLEGAEACVGTASGMAAILTTCLTLLNAGDHIVSARALFGSTVGLFNNHLSRFGIDTTFVPLADLDAWEAAITPRTRMLFLETPTNPLTEVGDLAALAELADKHDILLVVDNCFCTPALQRPFEFGAHIVLHSATKFLDGHGRCIGGAVLGGAERVGGEVFRFVRSAGPSMSPFNAWVFLKGLETLDLRMRAHSESALRIAQWLEEHSAVEHVYYPGLASHPQHQLAARQQSHFGGVVSFDLKDGRAAAWKLANHTELFSITANLGDTRSTITHPATTTHGRLTPEQRAEAGVGEGLIRIAVGLEDTQDLIDDLNSGLG